MNNEDIIKYKSLYLQTSWGYLNMLRKNIAFLLHGRSATSAVDSAHLAAHSLKSQSILMGYTKIGELCEEMEHIFQESKQNSAVPDEEILKIMLESLKTIQLSLTQISENAKELDLSEETDRLRRRYGK
ncbi:MAG TPA: Hpt domain-containing protein [Candidatus Saccharimonadales bacterium]|nr:Hpt domain-containing protein [Candidatus Saccharimonadales bacterium]